MSPTDRNRPAGPPRGPAEDFEPYEEHRGIPIPVLWVAVALAVWGVFMLYTSAKVPPGVTRPPSLANLPPNAEPPADGAQVFAANCATCHQDTGVGIKGAVPPLAGAEFPKSGPRTVAMILLRGIDGPITVAGQTYDGHMPDFASALSDNQIAAAATYVARHFGGSKETIAPDAVAALRARSQGRGSFSGGAEIAQAVPGLPAQPAAAAPPPQHQAAAEITNLVFHGKATVWSCASCHGELGQGGETIPRLAGLPAAYITKQLKGFRDGTRINESMRLVATGLSDDEMKRLGVYYSRLVVPSNARPVLGGDLARGQLLATQGDWRIGVPGCFKCHGSSGFGVAPGFPALAAQHAPYIARQIDAWTGGTRRNAPLGLMRDIARALSTEDRRAVADYLASLPPVPAQNAAGTQEANK